MALEFQHFNMSNAETGKKVFITIGPMPISMWAMETYIKTEFKNIGVKYGPNWIIDKAWIDKKSTVSCMGSVCP